MNGPRGPVRAKTYSSGDPLPLAPALPEAVGSRRGRPLRQQIGHVPALPGARTGGPGGCPFGLAGEVP